MRSYEQQDVRRIRVVIAEDHHIVRNALHKRLAAESYLEVVGEAENGPGLLRVAREIGPDLVLMDADMPDHDPAEATERLHAMNPGLKVIILSMHDTARYVVSSIQAGVDGYVLKDDPADALPQAIRHVMAGSRWISPQLTELLAHFVHNGYPTLPAMLTDREQEVLVALASGYRNDKIAEVLVISENTVRNHIASIFQKLGVETRVEAVVYALSLGLVTLDELAIKSGEI